MKKQSRVLCMLLAMVMVFALAACGTTAAQPEAAQPADAEKPAAAEPADAEAATGEVEVEWDYMDLDPATHTMVILLKQWSDEILEKSGGRFKINIRVGGELPFSTSEYLDAVSDGSVEMAGCMVTAVAGSMQAGGLPCCMYMITDAESLDKVMGILAPYLKEEFDSYGVTDVMNLYYPSQDVYGSGAVPATYKDMAGLKLRTTGSEQSKFWQAVGLLPTSIDNAEVSSALNTNVINGVTTATMAVLSGKWYESLDWMYVCHPMLNMVYGLVNNEAYAALPNDLKAVFDEVTADFQARFAADMDAAADDCQAELEANGIQVVYASDEEVAELKAIAVPMWDEFAEKAGDNAVEALALIKEALEVK